MTALQEIVADLTEYVQSMEARQEPRLRLLMNPVYTRCQPDGGIYRFVRESNNHPGHCAEDCWHYSPTAAIECFEGRAG